ncbi:MAG: sugar phosphate isomerase/epimerase [Candidatus Niameybacter stercoravium]|nr:sugar phosphate isomerase/epimerase [Candidatus Niameybacter stercoravium]
MSKLAVQLYTVREEAGKDFIGTLEKVAALGYEGVEFAGFFDTPANILKDQLDRLGLVPVGSHTPLEQLVDHLDEVITYNKTIGNPYIVCPWSEVKDEESLGVLAAQLQKVVQRLQDEGMMLLYHNHDHEFKKIGENYLLDLLFEKCEGLYAQIDTYWVHHAGVDVIEYLMKHKDRVKLIHLKDGTGHELKAIGEGTAPVKQVMKLMQKWSMEWVIVENDEPSPNGLKDIERSMTYIKNQF